MKKKYQEKRERQAKGWGCHLVRQIHITVEVSHLDEEATVNNHSALTPSRGNDAPIHAKQISCRGQEGQKGMKRYKKKREKKKQYCCSTLMLQR